MTTSMTRAAALCALLATTCLVSPALAQTAPPPPYQSADANGVDLVSGEFTFALEEGSIGGGEGALSLVRYWAQDAGWTDNWTGGLSLQSEPSGVIAHVNFGATSDSFSQNGATYTSREGNGATLVELGSDLEGTDYEYTSSDGVVIRYRYANAGHTPSLAAACPGGGSTCARPIWVRNPNGVRFDLDWEQGERCLDATNCTATVFVFRLRSVTSSAGYRFSVSHASENVQNNDWWRRAAVTFGNDLDPCGANCPTVSYATSGNALTVNAQGREWRFTTGANGLERIKRPGANTDTTVIGYGANGVSSVTRDGVTSSYARTVGGDSATMTVTDAASRTLTIESDLATYRPTRITDPLNRVTEMEYDPQGRPVAVIRPEGQRTDYAYDVRGNVTSVTQKAKPGSGLADIVTTAAYPPDCVTRASCNLPTSTTDAMNNVTEYQYNAAGQPTQILRPAAPNGVRPRVDYGYAVTNGVSLPSSVSTCRTEQSCAGTADEVKTSLTYGPNLLPDTVSTGAGDGSLTAVTAMAYDAVGNLVSVDGPLPGPDDTTRTRYNAAREVVGVIGPDPDGAGPLKHRAVRMTIDAQGLAIAQENGTVDDQGDGAWNAFAPLERTDATIDGNGRVVKQTLTAGGTVHAAVEYSYDVKGRVECVAQRMDPASFGRLNDACTPTAAGAFGPDRITRTVYDAAGRVVASEVAVGTADAATEARATYAANGQLETLTDGEGNRTTYAYDGHDRLSRTLYPVLAKGADASSTTDYEELGYDARGLVTSRRLRDGQAIGYGYDALGRLTGKDVPNAAFFENDASYGYDNLGRLVRASDGSGLSVELGWDALGRMVSQGSNWYGTTRSQYDLGGRRTRLTHRDGFFVAYEHLVTGETTAIRENGGLALARFGYDDLGRRTSLTRGNGTATSYAYDPVSRLQTLTQDVGGSDKDLLLGFGYNPASQIASATRSNDLYSWTGQANGTTGSVANGLNQLVQQGGAALAYDGRGNLTSDGTRSYRYTAENRLATAGATGGSPAVNLAYDPVGRLIHLDASRTDLLYDGADVIGELEAFGGPLRSRFVHGPGVDEPLVWYEGSGTSDRRYLHADERGSIVAVTDNAGATIGVNRYDEYGVPAATNIGRFQYTGQKWLGELGLYDYKARMYDPGKGRFLQADPIGYEAGPNMYAYVKGDPVNRVDPRGLCTVENWVMHVYDARGNDLGPDMVHPERWSTLRGCNSTTPGGGPRAYGGGGRAEDRPRHSYPINGRVTPPNTRCSVAQVAKILNHYAVPGADGPKTSGGTYTAYAVASVGNYEFQLWLGDVSFQSESGGTTIRNTTLANHAMRWGSVEMSVTGSQRDGFSIVGKGYGTNLTRGHAWANQKFAPSTFNVQLQKMAEALKQCN